jgi:hypothetical protein
VNAAKTLVEVILRSSIVTLQEKVFLQATCTVIAVKAAPQIAAPTYR